MANAELTVQVRTAFAEVVDLIPPKVRTGISVGSVVVAIAALGSMRIVSIWWPEGREQVEATVAEVVPWLLFVGGVVGAAYRPTRNEYATIEPQPVVPTPLDLARAQESSASTIAMLSANGWNKDEALLAVQQQQLLPTVESPGAQKDAGGAQATP